MKKLLFAFLLLGTLGCHSSGSSQKVVKPRYHHVWARGNKYRVDIPIGNRHIRFLQRKRTKAVSMK